MAERLHYRGVTWLGGSCHYFRRFDQIRQPKDAWIGTRQSGTIDPSARSICVEGMSHEDADAEQDSCCRDDLAHSFSPCLEGELSTGSFPDDFTVSGKWFRQALAVELSPPEPAGCLGRAGGACATRHYHELCRASGIAIPLSPNFAASSAASCRFPNASHRQYWETGFLKISTNYLIYLVQLGGLEPPTSCSTDRRSNQLSYNCILGRARKGSPNGAETRCNAVLLQGRRRPISVVPANAGTHNHWPILLKRSFATASGANPKRHGV